ncbi:MAG: GntR family transcriptional regulator [Pseudomonadota bacterium]|nr:GntR family transcriptional regulator [Pseudomonadota bacterium]
MSGPEARVRYRVVADSLRREIASGRFAKAQVLPGERELSQMFEVSRATLRRAVAALVDEGALFQRQGAGTFIRRAAPKVDQPFSRLVGFSELMRLRGFSPSSRNLEMGVYLPSPEEMTSLAIGPEESVMRLSRLRLADEAPMAIEHTTVPARFLPSLDKIGVSLYDALAATGHPPTRGLQRLRAVLLSDEDAALLGVPTGSPVLYIQRIAYLADGRGVEFTRSYYRSDTYEFVSEVTPGRTAKGRT